MAAPTTVHMMSAASVPADLALANRDPFYGAQHHPVPLDAPDVALRGQRLMAYGKRLCREETDIEVVEPGCAHHPARPHRPMAGHQLPEVADRNKLRLPWLLMQEKTSEQWDDPGHQGLKTETTWNWGGGGFPLVYQFMMRNKGLCLFPE